MNVVFFSLSLVVSRILVPLFRWRCGRIGTSSCDSTRYSTLVFCCSLASSTHNLFLRTSLTVSPLVRQDKFDSPWLLPHGNVTSIRVFLLYSIHVFLSILSAVQTVYFIESPCQSPHCSDVNVALLPLSWLVVCPVLKSSPCGDVNVFLSFCHSAHKRVGQFFVCIRRRTACSLRSSVATGTSCSINFSLCCST